MWNSVTSPQQTPPSWIILATAAGALLFVLHRQLWPVTRHLVTTAHEGAHGLVALLAGRRLAGIRLHSDSSGLAVSRGRPTGPGMMAMLLAGYPGPAIVGLGVAALLASGHALAALWLLLALLTLLLVQIRNWFGLWSVLVTGALLFAVTWFAPEQLQSAVAYLIAWFLLFGAVRGVVELRRSRRRSRGADSDADQLARLSALPAGAWIGLFFVVALLALALGAWWLVDDSVLA